MLHQGQRLLLQLLRGLAVYVSDFYLKKKNVGVSLSTLFCWWWWWQLRGQGVGRDKLPY